MHVPLLVLAVVVGLPAALRSTWSPCGWSMLSTLTPLAERTRGHRYWATASWFILGAAVGGACLGAVMAGLAAIVAWAGWSLGAVAMVAAVCAALAALLDAGVLGVSPPFLKRQVDDAWLRQYRPWVYGSGFGWQIGTGLTTYIMTTGVPLLLVLAALIASPGVAFAVGVGFGLARGSAVLLGSRIHTPADAVAFHRRFDALGEPVRRVVIAVLVVVAGSALGLAAGWLAGVVGAVALGLPILFVGRLASHDLGLAESR